jgi:hypothetical protein
MSLTVQAVVRLESFGAGRAEIQAIERVLSTSEVFCFAKPHADRFEACVEKAQAVECLKSVLEGLTGWKGDSAKEVKRHVRNWIRRANKAGT